MNNIKYIYRYLILFYKKLSRIKSLNQFKHFTSS